LILGRVGREIAGFSYGFIFPRDLWWSGTRDEPPDAIAKGTKYAVIELVVGKAYQGRGYSRIMMDALLQNRSEDYAILLAKPGAQAHAMYQRWGWQIVGQVQSYPHWPVDDAMILSLVNRS
jgi:GNAT superfamily N-acetyltransferase